MEQKTKEETAAVIQKEVAGVIERLMVVRTAFTFTHEGKYVETIKRSHTPIEDECLHAAKCLEWQSARIVALEAELARAVETLEYFVSCRRTVDGRESGWVISGGNGKGTPNLAEALRRARTALKGQTPG